MGAPPGGVKPSSGLEPLTPTFDMGGAGSPHGPPGPPP